MFTELCKGIIGNEQKTFILVAYSLPSAASGLRAGERFGVCSPLPCCCRNIKSRLFLSKDLLSEKSDE